MISMAAIGGAGAAASYYTKDNYYTDRDASEASAWTGEGAERAGLAGAVGVDAFKEILEGRMPDGTVLQPGRDGVHAPGMDMTFSAPKSLSLLAYLGGDERLLAANMDAVKKTLAWAEKNLAETRMARDGKTVVVKTNNLVTALFQHDTNRNLDPQAHIHAVIANATQGPDGKWRALHNGKLWEHNTLLGSIYHAQLRANVEALGYTIGSVGKHGSFEIAGISRAAIEVFSTRRMEILATAAAKLDHQSPQGLRAVTLRSRDPKPVIENRADLRQTWRDRASAIGLDLSAIVGAARAATSEIGRAPQSKWQQLTDGIRDAVQRARVIVGYVRNGGDRDQGDIDPYLPHNSQRLSPADLGSASAVASAIRHLSERETSFDILKVYKAALDLGLPVQIGGVETSVRQLLREVKLVKGVDGKAGELTTPEAIVTERRLLEAAAAGRGQSNPVIANAQEAGERLQAAAVARNGFALNSGQESAGRLLLAGSDRVVNIQGVAGAGKSSALGAVADVARAAGRNVIALGPQHVLVRDLEASSGIASITIAKFVRTHEKLLMEKTFVERIDLARTMFKDSIVIVDEASMASNSQMGKLVDLANKLDFKLALVGDKRQLGAVEAGKPFELMQRGAVDTALMTENLRARTPMLQEAAKLAYEHRVGDAFRTLAPTMTEAPGRMSEEAAHRWLARSPEDRAATLLLASGRKVRHDLNVAVQAGLLREGTLRGSGMELTIVDKMSITREEERLVRSYAPGQVLEFARDLTAQGIKAGRGAVVSVDYTSGTVDICRADGSIDTLKPSRLAPNRVENSVRLGEVKTLKVYEGDIVRWTDNDAARGLYNAAKATITAIDSIGVTVTTSAGMALTLPHGDKMLERLDLGYAMNAHGNQGVTADKAIGVIDSRETNLTNARLFLVQITRVRDGLELVVNDADRIVGGLERNSGDKTSALETIGVTRDAQATQPQPPHSQSSSPPRPTPPPAEKPGSERVDPPVPVRELNRDRQMDLGL